MIVLKGLQMVNFPEDKFQQKKAKSCQKLLEFHTLKFLLKDTQPMLLVRFFSKKDHSSIFVEKVFEVILRETVKDEQQENDLKRLKNWDEDKVEQLYRLFLFGSILLALIGIFFVGFGIFNLLIEPNLIVTFMMRMNLNNFLANTRIGISVVDIEWIYLDYLGNFGRLGND